MTEEWRPVKGYEGIYEVSNLGRVRRLDGADARGHKIKGRVLTQRKTTNGYLQVHLSYGVAREYLVHRLVATAFCEKWPGTDEVNHIDEDKHNNRAENLEWVTKTENQRHGTLPQRMRNRPPGQGRAGSKAVLQMSLNTKTLIAEYPSCAAAERATGIKAQNIGAAALGRIRQAGGYHWQYKTE